MGKLTRKEKLNNTKIDTRTIWKYKKLDLQNKLDMQKLDKNFTDTKMQRQKNMFVNIKFWKL